MSKDIKKFNSISDIAKYIMNIKDKETDYSAVVRIISGYGSKKQYKDVKKLESRIDDIIKYFPKDRSVLIYFGDIPNKNKPDIGYVHEYISIKRPDIKIIMIQIKEMEKYGVPKFVSGVYFHNDYDNKHKWGGFEEINNEYKVYSNTKQWLKLHYLLKKINKNQGIAEYYSLGTSGPESVSYQEYKLLEKLYFYSDEKNPEDNIYLVSKFGGEELESKY